jgi:carbon storage regulator
MLVIRRRIGESLFVGDDVEIELLDICGGQVKLGINAPREVVILRREVRLTAEANRLAARHISPEMLARLTKKIQFLAHEGVVPPDKHQ